MEFWPDCKGRDGCRTPIAWSNEDRKGGFTTGKPWLPLDHEHLLRPATQQEQDPTSILHHYRRAIAFRQSHSALKFGFYRDVRAEKTVLSFVRSQGDVEIFCAFNLCGDPATVGLPAGSWQQIGQELGSARPGANGRLHLGPRQPCIAIRASTGSDQPRTKVQGFP